MMRTPPVTGRNRGQHCGEEPQSIGEDRPTGGENR
jgi:hypothetical protein